MMGREQRNATNLTIEKELQQALVPDDEQPYKVPSNWYWTYVGKICSLVGGGTPSKNVPEYWNGNIPWASIKDIKGDRLLGTIDHISEAGVTNSATNICKRGNLILATRIEPGKTIVSEIDTAINQDLKIVVSKLNALFLHYYFQTNKSALEKKSSGSTVLGITVSNVENTEFPLPPLAEQQRIVDRIECLFAKLDEARDKVQEVLDGFEARKAAILHKAFTGELTAQWRKEHGVGMERWISKTLGSMTDILSSKRIYKEEYVEQGIPFFRSSEVVDFHDRGYTEPQFFITEQRYDEIAKQYGVPQIGDLLVTSVGTIGKTWIADERKFYYKDGNLTLVKQCKGLNMRYLQYYIKSERFKRQVGDTVAGSAYNALTIVKFKRIFIPVCMIEEQLEVITILDNLITREQQAKEAAETILEQINLIKKSILARAFRGELGTNDPNEPSAMELLKEIIS